MAKFIRVSKVIRERSDPYSDEEHDGGEDKLVATCVNVEAIKSYYPRKYGRRGTRINFIVGNGFAVAHTIEEFDALLGQAGSELIGEYPSADVVNLNEDSATEGAA